MALAADPQHAVQELVADSSGQQFLLIADGQLFRWDIGNAAPRKIADAVVAVDWLGGP